MLRERLCAVQAMLKLLAAVAIAATHFVSGTAACGWLNEVCCNIHYNNPNIGDCIQDRTVCWEGQCMGCGTNGKIACPSAFSCCMYDRQLYSTHSMVAKGIL